MTSKSNSKMTSYLFNKHVMNAKSQTEAFEEAMTSKFEFENPEDIEQEIMGVASRYQHLKPMAWDVNRFKFCDFDELKEVSATRLELLARHEKSANFLKNAATAYDYSKHQVQTSIKVQKWEDTKYWQQVNESAKGVLDVLASWKDMDENQALGGYEEEEDSLMSLDSDSCCDGDMICDHESLDDEEGLKEGEVTSLFEDGVVILLPLVGGTRVLRSTPQFTPDGGTDGDSTVVDDAPTATATATVDNATATIDDATATIEDDDDCYCGQWSQQFAYKFCKGSKTRLPQGSYSPYI